MLVSRLLTADLPLQACGTSLNSVADVQLIACSNLSLLFVQDQQLIFEKLTLIWQ